MATHSVLCLQNTKCLAYYVFQADFMYSAVACLDFLDSRIPTLVHSWPVLVAAETVQ